MDLSNYVHTACLVVQMCCIFGLLVSGFIDKNIVCLRSVLCISSFLYFTLPLFFLVNATQVTINDAHIIIKKADLNFISMVSTLFVLGLLFLPKKPFDSIINSIQPLWFMFVALSILSWVELFRFAQSVDIDYAFRLLSSITSRDYRDYSYSLLVSKTSTYLRYTNIVCFATGLLLWKDGKTSRLLLLVGVLPIVLTDIVTLSRLSLASLLMMVACTIPRTKVVKLLPLLIFIGFCTFFYRTAFLMITDSGYTGWLTRSISPTQSGLEFLGEFFNTFGTNFMVANIDIKNIDGLNLFVGAGLLPPGLGKYWYELTGVPFQIDYVANQILDRYGVHPAHSSLIDFYIFGPFGILGFSLYLLLCRFASKSNFELSSLMYLILVGFYYVPFRGSLLLSVSRLVWLYAVIFICYISAHKIVLYLNAFRKSR